MRRYRAFPPLFLVVVAASLTSCGGSSASSGGGGGSTPEVRYLYSNGSVTDGNGNVDAVILECPLTSSGSAVVPTVAATLGINDRIGELRSDGAGKLYAITFPRNSPANQFTIFVYSIASGNLSLLRSFTYDPPSVPQGIAADSSGNVYVNLTNGPMLVFAASASGNAAPAGTYPITASFGPMATDSSGHVYTLVKENNVVQNNSVYEYSASPSGLTLTNSFPFNSSFPYNGLVDIAVDRGGNIYVLGASSTSAEIQVIAAGSSTPAVLTSTSSTPLGDGALAVSPDGQVWATGPDISATSPPLIGRTFFAFSQGALGSTAQASSFSTDSPTDYSSSDSPAMAIY